jgi:hypothetical protein
MESEEIQENSKENITFEINQLNKALSYLKKENQKSEKDEILLNKKNNVLNIIKNLTDNKRKNELKFIENKKKIRLCISNDKNILKQKLQNDKENLEKQKIKNFCLKHEINKTLELRKINFTEKNKKEADKMKQEKIQIKEILSEMKEKNLNEKKQIHDHVQIDKIRMEEKKNYEKEKKRQMLKNKLKIQIEEEIAKLGKFKKEEEIKKIMEKYKFNYLENNK